MKNTCKQNPYSKKWPLYRLTSASKCNITYIYFKILQFKWDIIIIFFHRIKISAVFSIDWNSLSNTINKFFLILRYLYLKILNLTLFSEAVISCDINYMKQHFVETKLHGDGLVYEWIKRCKCTQCKGDTFCR